MGYFFNKFGTFHKSDVEEKALPFHFNLFYFNPFSLFIKSKISLYFIYFNIDFFNHLGDFK